MLDTPTQNSMEYYKYRFYDLINIILNKLPPPLPRYNVVERSAQFIKQHFIGGGER